MSVSPIPVEISALYNEQLKSVVAMKQNWNIGDLKMENLGEAAIIFMACSAFT